MKKIPAAYHQQHTKKQLIEILDAVRSHLLIDLKSFYKLYAIDAPMVSEPLSGIYNNRCINFDNLKDASLYQYLNYPDLAMIKMVHELDNKHGVFAYYCCINRDSEYTFVKSPFEYKFIIERPILLVDGTNNEIIKNTASEIIALVNETITQLKIPHAIKIPANLKFVTLTKLKKYYPTISTDDALNEYVRKNESVLLLDIDETFEHIHTKDIIDFFMNGSLYVKSNVNNEIIRIASFNLVPTKEQVIERFKYESNSEDITNLINNNEKLFMNYNDILGIEINFHRLMLYVLQKMHMAEILEVPLSDELKEQFKKNKLSRF